MNIISKVAGGRGKVFSPAAFQTIWKRHFAFISAGKNRANVAAENEASSSDKSQDIFESHKSATNVKRDFKVGPYKRGKFWVNPKEDPWSFAMNVAIVSITVYFVLNLSPGEPIHVRRKRIIRERLLREYGLTEADLDEIEGEEAPLSDSVDSSSKSDSQELDENHEQPTPSMGTPNII
ncbi:hypothetical protein IE077_002403 [Cardiosporidium cionae]|uniref:Uncharacterized protein n=1 Tax=Cardiosporidium cionae TaxID=476202 RepID=A0ABQ7JB28_9APIC|nr:hypothetical protein IE077_002403 [Cardiosporidium cionae]|eukprot:KAF8821163.1 hypothetical protein IE077_002403 [Cardiosporidium cionae]